MLSWEPLAGYVHVCLWCLFKLFAQVRDLVIDGRCDFFDALGLLIVDYGDAVVVAGSVKENRVVDLLQRIPHGVQFCVVGDHRCEQWPLLLQDRMPNPVRCA